MLIFTGMANGDTEYVCLRNDEYPSCPADGCIELLQPIINAISEALRLGFPSP